MLGVSGRTLFCLSIPAIFRDRQSMIWSIRAISTKRPVTFSVLGDPVRFHRHQAQSIAKARTGQSYVVTTGTGSGKSLCFFVPVVDAIVRARKAGRARKTSAIIVYPMNALANSQINEIDKFISQSGLPSRA